VFVAVTRGGDEGTMGLFVGAGIDEMGFLRDDIAGAATNNKSIIRKLSS